MERREGKTRRGNGEGVMGKGEGERGSRKEGGRK